MSMAELQADEAALFLNALLPQLKREHRTTLKVIEAVPVDKGDYKPDPGSMSALELAWHLAAAEVFFMTAAAAGEFSEGAARPEHILDSAAVAKWYQDNFAKCFERVRALTPDELLKRLPFHSYNETALAWLQFMLTHSIHHRGQLTVYLRPMGATVPPMHG
jgi:uncharacterized damage-inducible protein DinB